MQRKKLLVANKWLDAAETSAVRSPHTGEVLLEAGMPSGMVNVTPYGGEKDSGLGREGVRYAIEEMTSLRLLVLNFVEKSV
jgi:acyl-CoA reductase-like NAD-dependent aldehyde dehydrogenase